MLLIAGILGQLFLALKTDNIEGKLISLVATVIEENTIDGQIRVYIDQKASAFSNEVEKTAKRAVELASIFCKSDVVSRAYETAHEGDINDPSSPQSQAARDLLRKELAPVLREYREATGSSEPLNLHYHLPNGRSLVRLWRDGYQVVKDGKKLDISDDISDFRKTVMDINLGSEKSLQGIEVGRGGFAIRGLCKIQDENGKALGSDEVLLSFDDVTKVLTSGKSEVFEVYMVDSLLDVATKLKDSAENPVRGRFVRIKTSAANLGTKLFDPNLASKALRGVVYEKTDKYYVGMFPVPDYSGKPIGVVSMYIPLDEQQALIAAVREDMAEAMGSIKWITLIVNVLTMVVVAIAIWIIADRITRKTSQLTTSMDVVSVGDLTHTIQSEGVREYSEISVSVNSFVTKLRDSFRVIFAQVSSLVAYSDELKTSSELAAEGSKVMDQSTESVSKSIEQVKVSATEILESSDSLTQDMNSISSAIEELNASFREISSNCIREREITEEAAVLVQDSNDVMSKLEKHAIEIGSVIDIIRSIADQTNLLALNATIEAASAGEAGKGFAVVASEVKELARQSADAAGRIGEQIQEVQLNTKNASESISKVTDVIDSVTQYATAIASAVEEQTTATEMISQNVVSATDSTLMLKQSVDESAAAIDKISGNIDGLRKQSLSVSSVAEGNLFAAAQLSQIAEEFKNSVAAYNLGKSEFDIHSVKSAHMKWNRRLSDAIAGNSQLRSDEVTTSQQCDFGKWIDRIDQRSLGDSSAAFRKMVELHDKVHKKAGEIVDSVNSNDRLNAGNRFREYQDVRSHLFEAINEFYVTSS